MNYRVALCISGRLQNFRYCFPNVKKFIIDRYHTDVFVCIGENESDEDIADAYRLYNPQDFKKINYASPSICICENSKKNCDHLFHIGIKMLKCDRLRRNMPYTYDAIIRIRPDIQPFEPVPDYVIQSCASGSTDIWTPITDIKTSLVNPSSFFNQYMDGKHINDQLIVASPSTMALFCEKFYETIITRAVCEHEPDTSHDLFRRYNPLIITEYVMSKVAQRCKFREVHFSYSYLLIREDGCIHKELWRSLAKQVEKMLSFR
jgi:hypothetical protein